ncbi:enoyl-CoA hydratase-related protein [Aquincola sp. MAHUQ-54]|uniref:Enoyl-CoA hydratase-related protein n=1 Tax=Aquincola agrisoli TaxID=3119538 RepID=A0AAW9QFA7_9BURK
MTHSHEAAALVTSRLEDGVLTLSMNAVDNGNAMTVAMSEALALAFEQTAKAQSVQCVVLRSSARHFCTGGSVEDMQAGADLMQGSVEDVRDRLASTLHRVTRATQAIEVPLIAAVDGAAVGAGFDLALMCDIRIASERARFAESFLRLGLISGIGGAWFLSRLVGLSKAMELTFTSEFLDAPAALAHGIVSRVVAPDRLDDEAASLARRIAATPPRALRMAKTLVRESATAPLSTALEMAASMQAMLLCGAEHKNAVDTFLAQQKRR